jgi:hypothetical protein
VAWRRPRLVWAHIPAVVVTAAIFAFGADCPLTDLEKYLRRQAGERAYRGGFIAQYLLPMVPDGVRAVAVPVVVVVVTAAAYVGYIARRRQHSSRARSADRVGPGRGHSALHRSLSSSRSAGDSARESSEQPRHQYPRERAPDTGREHGGVAPLAQLGNHNCEVCERH